MNFVFALLPAILLSGCIMTDFGPSDRYRSSFHYNFDLQPEARVNLEGLNGPVEILGWDQNKVEISGEKYASTEAGLESIRIDIHNDPHSVDIRTRVPSARFGSLGVSFIVHVPNGVRLDRITTSNGQIHIRDTSGEANVRTSNSPIHLENLKGAVDAQTSNGRIEASDLEAGANLRTSNGRVDISLRNAPKNSIRAESSNGGITVRLPADTSALIGAKTSNGFVSSEFNVAGNAHDSKARPNHMTGVIGGGGPLISLTTSNGSISLLRR